MTWAAALGIGSQSLGLILLGSAIIWLVVKLLGAGDDKLAHYKAQLDAESLRRTAENDRDAALRKVTERDAQLVARDQELADQRQLLIKAHDRLKEHVDDASDADLVDLTHAVFGVRPRQEGGGGETTSSSGDDSGKSRL